MEKERAHMKVNVEDEEEIQSKARIISRSKAKSVHFKLLCESPEHSVNFLVLDVTQSGGLTILANMSGSVKNVRGERAFHIFRFLASFFVPQSHEFLVN